MSKVKLKVDNAESSTLKDYVTTVTILENIPDAVFILRNSGKIKFANKTALELLQIEQHNLIGKLIDDFLIDSIDTTGFHSATNRETFDKKQRLIDQLECGKYGDVEATLINREQIIPVFLNFKAVRDANNDVEYIIVTAKDISHWKRLERELRLQQALSVSNDRLRALGEFSIGLIHELSQPLGTLKLKMDMTRSSHGNTECSKIDLDDKLSEMSQLINRIANIIENIRSFAERTEDQTFTMIDINRTIDSACWLTAYEMEKRDIKLTISKSKNMPYIVENAISIEQVLVNLLMNARDAFDEFEKEGKCSDNLKKEIIITTKSFGRKWVKIIIKDNAGGIDAQIVDRIFEPFFTTKESGLNTGVGLTISKSIITLMGGDINVKVNRGKGATFTIRIPISRKDEREQLLTLIEMANK
ncbi:MAG: PAS domain-containing protein [Calditrichaeota bacterium]|nr:PAS domain-containing protein [Calditrichota bacterium]